MLNQFKNDIWVNDRHDINRQLEFSFWYQNSSSTQSNTITVGCCAQESSSSSKYLFQIIENVSQIKASWKLSKRCLNERQFDVMLV